MGGLPWYIFPSPHRSVSCVKDFRTGGLLYEPLAGPFSFPGLMTIVVTGFLPQPLLSIVLMMVMWESSQWLGKNIV